MRLLAALKRMFADRSKTAITSEEATTELCRISRRLGDVQQGWQDYVSLTFDALLAVGDIPKHRYQTSHTISHPRTKTLRQGSLAVLPFEVIGGDEEQRYFADGLTDDLIVELARFKNLFVSSQSAVSSYESKAADPRVVGRELGVKHVLLGQVRRIAERVRVSVRLVNASSGENLWAERYERRWDELFDLLDELIARIAATIVGQVQEADIAEARRKLPENMTAYDCLLRGLEHHRLWDPIRAEH